MYSIYECVYPFCIVLLFFICLEAKCKHTTLAEMHTDSKAVRPFGQGEQSGICISASEYTHSYIE